MKKISENVRHFILSMLKHTQITQTLQKKSKACANNVTGGQPNAYLEFEHLEATQPQPLGAISCRKRTTHAAPFCPSSWVANEDPR